MKSKLAINGGEPTRTKMYPKGCIFDGKYKLGLEKVLDGGVLSKFGQGDFVRTFEQQFADFHGVKYGISTNSGTAALHTSLASLDAKVGDEVIVPAFTFGATVNVVIQEKCIPVFADIDPVTYCIDPIDVEQKITGRTRAIIPVHLFGHPADIVGLNDISHKYGLKIVEDACQAHGAKISGNLIGTFGNLTCYSFNQTKNMTCGEGGMILTNDEELKEKLLEIARFGISREPGSWYIYSRLGFNYLMTEMQAVIGILQLSELDEMNNRRRENSDYYTYRLVNTELTLPKATKNAYHVRHNYPILLPEDKKTKRDWFVEAVRSEGVPIDMCYPLPLYKAMRYLNNLSFDGRKVINNNTYCPVTENVSSRIITLYTDPTIDEELRKDMCDAVIKVYNCL